MQSVHFVEHLSSLFWWRAHDDNLSVTMSENTLSVPLLSQLTRPSTSKFQPLCLGEWRRPRRASPNYAPALTSNIHCISARYNPWVDQWHETTDENGETFYFNGLLQVDLALCFVVVAVERETNSCPSCHRRPAGLSLKTLST